eukprot:TRINITY_DN5231_c0_g1_i2.p1 TRINITY_DN5231_c0_g1~~TRINITY_DN5231_c0_g1_i2.p1  ORF type:complete len:281 (+),score=46.74 TRINITY_DN5231_c0_g1_i2:73-915(+)
MFDIYLPRKKGLHTETPDVHMVIPGDQICEAEGFMPGHGTFILDKHLIASVAGVVQKVNRLIYVMPMKARYNGEIGDTVVGRVTSVQNQRWKVEINAKQEGLLNLQAITLPDRKRKTLEDQLRMRDFFVENDVLSAEVQAVRKNGTINLQSRNRYGKLHYGLLVTVHPNLIKRCPSHFVTLNCGVELIIGMNGNIWISIPESLSAVEGEKHVVSKEMRLEMGRVKNIIMALSKVFKLISPENIERAYQKSSSYSAKHLLLPNVILYITDVDETTDGMDQD